MKIKNNLSQETSPYLLQHKNNPVAWQPWSTASLALAKELDRPIFLSIGYSTCHWCHVMEHESFEDDGVARLINKNFIAIKVDREERPDIDQIYMTVCQMFIGHGGWPLTIILDSDQKPFYAGTYLPKNNRGQQKGLTELLQQVQSMWVQKNTRQTLLNSSLEVTTRLQQVYNVSHADFPKQEVINQAFEFFESRFDDQFGGFGDKPKFPSPHNYEFLLDLYILEKNTTAKKIVYRSLKAFRYGGMFDHIGLGYHRYSTDNQWFSPHFEKMLYDQAGLLRLFSIAYLVFENKQWLKDCANEIISYLSHQLLSPEGGFYCGEDADSEGEEGTFYLWHYNDLENLLSQDELLFVEKYFSIEKQGI